jgi:hypothetical protein
MHGHYWKAIGILAATVGAITVTWAEYNGHHHEAKMLTVGAFLAGGVAAAIGTFTDGEQRRAHYARLEEHVRTGTPLATSNEATASNQLQALRAARYFG